MHSCFLMVAMSLACLALPGAAQQDKKPAPGGGLAAMGDLVGALKVSPGCLGVETARTASGKQVIFAWFEDKKAVVKWYHSDVHQKAMKLFASTDEYPQPLKEIAADTGPIMVIASLTPAKEEKLKGLALPVSQIAIELYQPLPGGAALGGRFSPPQMKAKGLRDYSEKDKN
jgi:hypothetical protein